MKSIARLIAATLASLAFSVQAEEKALNLYSARHYQTDEALYANFTKQTGIRINRIEGKEDELLERIRNEGGNSFVGQTEQASVGTAENAMGSVVEDLDGDGGPLYADFLGDADEQPNGNVLIGFGGIGQDPLEAGRVGVELVERGLRPAHLVQRRHPPLDAEVGVALTGSGAPRIENSVVSGAAIGVQATGSGTPTLADNRLQRSSEIGIRLSGTPMPGCANTATPPALAMISIAFCGPSFCLAT